MMMMERNMSRRVILNDIKLLNKQILRFDCVQSMYFREY